MKRSLPAAFALAVIVGAGLLAPVSLAEQQRAATVRFHHLHFRTGDVAAALAETVQRVGGSRVLLQGLGVGVRLGDRYVLFEVASASPDSVSTGGDPITPVTTSLALSARYREAVGWLTDRGVVVAADELGLPAAAATAWPESLHHIAFATGDLEAVARTLHESGAPPVRRTADSVFFRSEATVIEITRDPDLPDVLWCPMHPDVRASSPGKCPICAMDLVPIPPPRLGQYRIAITQRTAPRGRGASALTLEIRDPGSGQPIAAFAPVHERLLHLFIISRDLQYFAHEHPVQRGDRFRLAIDLAPGHYMLVADFLPLGGSPQMVHRAIVTPGYAGSPFSPAVDPAEDVADKVSQGVRVQLAFEPKPGRLEAALRLRFTDEKSGEPVRDLQPYLGASGHLLVVSTDLVHAIHAHPEGWTSGPQIDFSAEFPRPGLYKIWVQVQRGGSVLTAPFVVRVG